MSDTQNAPAASANTSGQYGLDAETLTIETEAAEALGRQYAEQYQSGKPFHYIGIDNFLPDAVAAAVRAEALKIDEKPPENSSAQEHLKASYHPDTLPHYTRLAFHALNAPRSCAFLRR